MKEINIDIDIININAPRDISGLLSRERLIDKKIESKVQKIIKDIREGGERSLLKYTRDIEGYPAKSIEDLKVSTVELDTAYNKVKEKKPKLARAIVSSKKNIKHYHQTQKKYQEEYWSIDSGPAKGTAQRILPVGRAGIYIPGGRYPYPSTVLMTAIPAQIAGVGSIAAFTPPDSLGHVNDVILFSLALLGVSEIYKIGGAQAVAVMAYGTDSIDKVDKIAGPGNIFVAAAKKAVFGDVGIDSLAGPSEIAILADKTADHSYIVSDLLSQAEHDPDALIVLFSDDIQVMQKTVTGLKECLLELSVKYGKRLDLEVLAETINSRCLLVYSSDMDMLIDACNFMAPEHLEIMAKDSLAILDRVTNAGAIFIGDYSPVALGDYYAGTNHVIPTAGNARFASPLGIYDFVKRSSITYYEKAQLDAAKEDIMVFADTENLIAHKESVKKRFEGDKKR